MGRGGRGSNASDLGRVTPTLVPSPQGGGRPAGSIVPQGFSSPRAASSTELPHHHSSPGEDPGPIPTLLPSGAIRGPRLCGRGSSVGGGSPVGGRSSVGGVQCGEAPHEGEREGVGGSPSPPCRAPSSRRGEGFRWGADGEADSSSFAPSGRRWREAPDEGATHRTASAFPLPKPKTLSYKLLLRSRYREASYDRYARFPGRSTPSFRDYGQAAPLGRSRKVTTIRT